MWLYVRFALSLRDVADILAARGVDVSYETVRCRVAKFGTLDARQIRPSRPRPSGRWHLDEMFVWTNGRRMYLSRAVDDEGEVSDVFVQSRRDKQAALKAMRKLLRRHGCPQVVVTDRPGSCDSNPK